MDTSGHTPRREDGDEPEHGMVLLVLAVAVAALVACARAKPASVSFHASAKRLPALYPWAVAVTFTEKEVAPVRPHCGGALVAPSVVLTAAHCVMSPTDKNALLRPLDSFRVVFGRSDLRHTITNDAGIYKVRKVVAHPDWTQSAHDVALLVLDGCQKGRKHVFIAENFQSSRPGVAVTTLGWGPLQCHHDKSVNFDMRLKEMHYTADSVLNLACNHEDLTSQNQAALCLRHLSDRAARQAFACEGDGGGPSFVRDADGNDVLVGITNRGSKDQFEFATARVSHYSAWIKEAMREHATQTCMRPETIQRYFSSSAVHKAPTTAVTSTPKLNIGRGSITTYVPAYPHGRTTSTGKVQYSESHYHIYPALQLGPQQQEDQRNNDAVARNADGRVPGVITEKVDENNFERIDPSVMDDKMFEKKVIGVTTGNVKLVNTEDDANKSIDDKVAELSDTRDDGDDFNPHKSGEPDDGDSSSSSSSSSEETETTVTTTTIIQEPPPPSKEQPKPQEEEKKKESDEEEESPEEKQKELMDKMEKEAEKEKEDMIKDVTKTILQQDTANIPADKGVAPKPKLCALDKDVEAVKKYLPMIEQFDKDAAAKLKDLPPCGKGETTCIPGSLGSKITPQIRALAPDELKHVLAYPACPE